MQIREAILEDLRNIQKLNNELFKLEYENFDDSLKKDWSLEKDGEEYFTNMINNDYVIVAIENTDIIGYLAGSINVKCSYNSEKIAEINNMFVKEEYRKNGVGKILINNFINYCKEKEINDIRVTASFKNTNAIQFYMNNGFEEFELTLRKKVVIK